MMVQTRRPIFIGAWDDAKVSLLLQAKADPEEVNSFWKGESRTALRSFDVKCRVFSVFSLLIQLAIVSRNFGMSPSTPTL